MARAAPAEGPAGLLARAEAHNATAIFILDTWTMFGLIMGAVGVAMLRFSRQPEHTRALAWTAIGIEVAGIVTDVNKLLRGYVVTPSIVWMLITPLAIVTGYFCLRGLQRQIPGARQAFT